MKQFSTDILALAAITGCTALGLGATAALMDGPRHTHDCLVEADGSTGFVISGERITVRSGGPGDVVVGPGFVFSAREACADIEDRRKRRRRPHLDHDHDRIQVQVIRARERADEARARAEATRGRAMERALEREMRAVEREMRAVERRLESGMEALESAAADIEAGLEAGLEDELRERLEADIRVLQERLDELAQRRRRRPR